MKNLYLLVTVAALAFGLIACGGGNSTSGSTINGVFADDPVVGLTYTCGTKTGVTGTGGTFTCPKGSTVTLSVGGITVCSAPVQAFMTPVSCAQVTNPSANTSTPSVVAVAQFLQSISTTPASSGTLTITSSELQTAANLTLDFSTATDSQLLTVVDDISSGASLVDATTASNELANTVYASAVGTTLAPGSLTVPQMLLTILGPLLYLLLVWYRAQTLKPPQVKRTVYRAIFSMAQHSTAILRTPVLGREHWIPLKRLRFSVERGTILASG